MRKLKFVNAFNKHAYSIIQTDSVEEFLAKIVPSEHIMLVSDIVTGIETSYELNSPLVFDTVVESVREEVTGFINNAAAFAEVKTCILDNIESTRSAFKNITNSKQLYSEFIRFTEMIIALGSLNKIDKTDIGVVRIINTLIVGVKLIQSFVSAGIDETKIGIIVSEILQLILLFGGKKNDVDIVKQYIPDSYAGYDTIFKNMTTEITMNVLHLLGILKVYFTSGL